MIFFNRKRGDLQVQFTLSFGWCNSDIYLVIKKIIIGFLNVLMEVQYLFLRGIGLFCFFWVLYFEEVVSIVDNIEIILWEGVYGNGCLETRGCGEDMIVFFKRIDWCVRREQNCVVLFYRIQLGLMEFMEVDFGFTQERFCVSESCLIIESVVWGDGASERVFYFWKCFSRVWMVICRGYCGKIYVFSG